MIYPQFCNRREILINSNVIGGNKSNNSVTYLMLFSSSNKVEMMALYQKKEANVVQIELVSV